MTNLGNLDLLSITNSVIDWVHHNYWILIESGLIIAGTYILNIIVGRFINKLKDISKRNKVFWDDVFISSLEKPMKIIIWIVGFTFIFDALNQGIKINLLKFSPIIRHLTIVMLASWVAINFIDYYESHLIKRSKKLAYDKFTIDFLSKILKILVFIVAGLIALDNFGFNISGLIALGGIGGAAIAFASQSLLANFFGTFIIYLDKPFAIADTIEIQSTGLRGTVEEIGWRVTKIRTPDQLPVYIQNAVFAKDSIINYSRITHKKLTEIIGISAGDTDQLQIIINDIQSYLQGREDIDKELLLRVVVNEFGQDFIDIKIETMIIMNEGRDFFRSRHEIMLFIYNKIQEKQLKVLFSNDNKQLLTRF